MISTGRNRIERALFDLLWIIVLLSFGGRALAAAGGPASGLRPSIYRVRPGDTLSGIAARHGLSVQALARLNGIQADGVLRIGEQLRVPEAGSPPSPLAGNISSAPTPRTALYWVQPGDTLSGIAARYGLSVQALARLNGIEPGSMLQAGERLRVPGTDSNAALLSFGPDFPCPSVLQSAVHFWIRVYTQVGTNGGFLHDPNNLGVVYQTVHFRPGSSPWERQHIVDADRDRLAAELRRIAAGARPLTPQERRIRALWGPGVSSARLRRAADDIRFQLGQSNRFKAGLIRSGAWQHAIARALAQQGLPPQLAALPLVESSYNPRAFSKDGAAGIWQFMPGTAQRFLRMSSAVDQRLDPFSATVAAAQLLAYNHRILGTWPLAITAYNHGLAGMLRAVRTVGTKNIGAIVLRYRTAMFGFASRNFYVSFLAALYVDEHAHRYFGNLHELPEERFHELTLPDYVSMASLERALDVPLARLRELNPALLPPVWDGELDVPKGYCLRLPERGQIWTVADLIHRLGPGALLAEQLRPAIYRVRWGDTLSGIAARFGLSIWALARFNDIQPDGILRVGEPLRLPGAEQPPALLAASAGPGLSGGYRVQPGDTLSGIAARYGVSVWALARLNGIQADGILRVGERLRLPGVGQPVTLLADDTGPAPGLRTAFYSVQPGDTLSGIAVRYGVSVWALARLNGIQADGILRVGERLRLPGVGQPAILPAGIVASAARPASTDKVVARGPGVGPGGHSALSLDPTDYSVAADGTIRVAAAESLGYYAEWLGVSAMDLRRINHLRLGQPLQIGERIRLDFRHATPAQFERQRVAYHRALEASYFATHRIDGVFSYVTRGGDSLWTLTQRFPELPEWLLRQYNPHTDFFALKPGTRLIVPRIEAVAAGS
jgi:membrane-bound lytic murein transglycosylase D